MAQTHDIEDVLSSIRRLVANEQATAPRAMEQTDGPALVLAKENRVTEPEDPFQMIHALAQESGMRIGSADLDDATVPPRAAPAATPEGSDNDMSDTVLDGDVVELGAQDSPDLSEALDDPDWSDVLAAEQPLQFDPDPEAEPSDEAAIEEDADALNDDDGFEAEIAAMLDADQSDTPIDPANLKEDVAASLGIWPDDPAMAFGSSQGDEAEATLLPDPDDMALADPVAAELAEPVAQGSVHNLTVDPLPEIEPEAEEKASEPAGRSDDALIAALTLAIEADETVQEAVAPKSAPAAEDDVDLSDLSGDLSDDSALRDLITEIVRQELAGDLGERITRNVRRLVRKEIRQIMAAEDFE